jgi:hypothetical protein
MDVTSFQTWLQVLIALIVLAGDGNAAFVMV